MTETHLDSFTAALPYPLDEFQVKGCQAVEDGHGVLVCAPTGAGKTIVGEFAVSLALSRGTKCFYTTPIKALSNQKYHDLVEEHGEEAVGLLTGDVSINSDAEIVVMTTEVLRNMIYAESAALDRLTHVVMDEIHFWLMLPAVLCGKRSFSTSRIMSPSLAYLPPCPIRKNSATGCLPCAAIPPSSFPNTAQFPSTSG